MPTVETFSLGEVAPKPPPTSAPTLTVSGPAATTPQPVGLFASSVEYRVNVIVPVGLAFGLTLPRVAVSVIGPGTIAFAVATVAIVGWVSPGLERGVRQDTWARVCDLIGRPDLKDNPAFNTPESRREH